MFRAAEGVPLAKIRLSTQIVAVLQTLQSEIVNKSIEKIDLSVSQIKRRKVALLKAITPYAELSKILRQTAAVLRKEDKEPASSNLVYTKSARAVVALSIWEEVCSGVEELPWQREYAKQILESYKIDEKFKLCLYVCPPVDFGMLKTEDPEFYFGTQVSGGRSFLSGQIGRLASLISICGRFGVNFDLQVIIGDQDEEKYIWPVLGVPKDLDQDKLIQRKNSLRKNVEEYLLKKLNIASENLFVSSLSEVSESSFLDDLNLFSANSGLTNEDINTEIQRMQALWELREPGTCPYYEGLDIPTTEMLRKIVLLKFLSYANDGLLAITQGSVIIQAEKPPKLRTKMLNAGRRLLGQEEWKAIYINPLQE